ncbi:MAG TPA: 2-dehydropantoate 2-reductase N-terminal domain-containing protein, partial [Anaerolineaceae bacterium]|nr:2-dehydropantoate 2-reductase N-terminal domain-containing protein [Anaerolineaceae bacterium]
MRFLCFGVGAIGTYIGGSLMLSGRDVVFLDRPETAAEVRRNGLKLVLPHDERRLATPTIVESIEAALEQGPYDFALVAVKSYDTPALLDMLRPYRADLPAMICLQNGVENENRLRSLVGFPNVIPATVTSAVGRLGPGQIVLERLRGVGLAYTPRVFGLLMAFDQAGLKPQIYADADAMKWSKLLTNLPANATSAILNWTPAQVFSHPGIFRLEVAQFREALAVMSAWPLRVYDLPGTPVRALAWT